MAVIGLFGIIYNFFHLYLGGGVDYLLDYLVQYYADCRYVMLDHSENLCSIIGKSRQVSSPDPRTKGPFEIWAVKTGVWDERDMEWQPWVSRAPQLLGICRRCCKPLEKLAPGPGSLRLARIPTMGLEWACRNSYPWNSLMLAASVNLLTLLHFWFSLP